MFWTVQKENVSMNVALTTSDKKLIQQKISKDDLLHKWTDGNFASIYHDFPENAKKINYNC
jgi:hypothetical protein